MFKTFTFAAAGAMLCASVLTFTAGGAGAFPANAPSGPAIDAGANLLHLTQGRGERRDERRARARWDRDRHGNRCSRRSDRCRHYHRGYYYEVPWWTLPLIIGGGIAASRDRDWDWDNDWNDGIRYGRRHVEWCLNRYRSYNPRTNTWVAYSGRVRQCNSPYS